MSSISVSSIPSIEIGSCSRAIVTWSAVRNLSGYPTTRSETQGGFGISSSVASSTVTHVDSVPTSERATSNPVSGRSSSRL